MKFAVQLFGPLNGMPGPLEEDLRALTERGITWVEPCVCLEPIPGMEKVFWPLARLPQLARDCRALGMELVSAHLFGRELTAHAEELADAARQAGLRAYVVKSPEKTDGASLQQAALNDMALADRLASAGVELWLHNEAGDIRAKAGDRTAYERLLDLCQGKVYAQVDVGWVQFAGEDPVALLRRNAGRVRAVHYKDFPAGAAEPVDVPIGTGGLDLAGCFRFAQSRDLPQYLDQEHFGPDAPGELARICGELQRFPQNRENTVSYLNILDTETGEVQVLARLDRVIEAPNWMKTQDALLYNAEGRMYRYDLATGAETLLDTGLCDQCNNDHVLSPDETEIAVSHMTFEQGFSSRVYRVPLAGGAPRLVTENSPSFLHGWSPDGAEMAYCAFREVDGRQEVDVYVIPAEGGRERRLTQGGFNDGPEYSPDGEWIWYNSTRSGRMQIWKMRRDGSAQTQVTENARNNWFAHLSPDGTKAAYLSYGGRQLEPQEHLPNMPVELWLMNADGSRQRRALSLFGGQGSMNVNSWAADSRRLAFVSYEIVGD